MRIVAIGLGATLLMDAWNLFLGRAFGVKSLDFCALGRMVSRARPCVVGWGGHYTIGMVLAAGFASIAPTWIDQPTLLPALAFGAVTVVFPIFLLQPALGIRSSSARVKSLGTHLVYGAGLFLGAELLRIL